MVQIMHQPLYSYAPCETASPEHQHVKWALAMLRNKETSCGSMWCVGCEACADKAARHARSHRVRCTSGSLGILLFVMLTAAARAQVLSLSG